MSSSRLRAFLAVARHGSFSAGARALGLAQPTLTAQIQSLEKQHDVELFHRRGRGSHLTPLGLALLPIAQQLGALEVDAFNLLHDAGKLNSGELRIGAVGPFHVIEMVDAYHRLYPGVDLSIRVGNSAEVLADLESYVTDIAVLAGARDAPGLSAIPYASHPVILLAPVTHPLACHDSLPLSALHDVPLLQREPGSTTRAALEAALAEAGVKPRTVMEIGSREALREAVARGLGMGTVSEAEFIPDSRFRPIRIEGDPVRTDTYLYCLAERRDSRLLSSFIDEVLKIRGDGPAHPA
ncbi:LysR substrate-binding domain-containing protein [Achromobacter xylosoxidans]|uniref:LysR family transcriptional regulator n=1 Tax=Alcaligenes xylosoxydans xylosoxydans TaxID=85698 RepID=A0A1R1K1N6_ALCXX|nr:LysR substrate-binding domain-containing protein [Achromobacter xylosoxidans]OMG93320.1 LysR family transcriptional regulator [Achromobacter xylosoxidans]